MKMQQIKYYTSDSVQFNFLALKLSIHQSWFIRNADIANTRKTTPPISVTEKEKKNIHKLYLYRGSSISCQYSRIHKCAN